MMMQVCRGALDEGPAFCATNITTTSTSLSLHLRIKLCSQATGVGPAQCFAQLPTRVPPERKARKYKTPPVNCLLPFDILHVLLS